MDTVTQALEALSDGNGSGQLAKDVRETMSGVTSQFGRDYLLDCWRENRFVTELWDKLGELGLLGVGVPEKWGGMGGGLAEMVLIMDLLSQAGTPPFLYALTCFSREPILRHGTPEQIEQFVVPTASGAAKICFAITESDAGTNSFRITTRAERTGSGWVLNGNKVFISGADHAELMMVIARTRPYKEGAERKEGLSVFVIDAKAPGVELSPLNIEMYLPERQFQVNFNDVEMPHHALIGPEGEGLATLFDALNPERLLISAISVGLGDFAIAKTVAYVQQRAPFGKPIGSYQGVQHPLARAKAHVDAARLMAYCAARTFDAGGKAGPSANMAKLLASEAGIEAVDAAIQFHGGYGFDEDYDIITLWPLVRLFKTAPLNNEMILNYIGEHVLHLPKSY